MPTIVIVTLSAAGSISTENWTTDEVAPASLVTPALAPQPAGAPPAPAPAPAPALAAVNALKLTVIWVGLVSVMEQPAGKAAVLTVAFSITDAGGIPSSETDAFRSVDAMGERRKHAQQPRERSNDGCKCRCANRPRAHLPSRHLLHVRAVRLPSNGHRYAGSNPCGRKEEEKKKEEKDGQSRRPGWQLGLRTVPRSPVWQRCG